MPVEMIVVKIADQDGAGGRTVPRSCPALFGVGAVHDFHASAFNSGGEDMLASVATAYTCTHCFTTLSIEETRAFNSHLNGEPWPAQAIPDDADEEAPAVEEAAAAP